MSRGAQPAEAGSPRQLWNLLEASGSYEGAHDHWSLDFQERSWRWPFVYVPGFSRGKSREECGRQCPGAACPGAVGAGREVTGLGSATASLFQFLVILVHPPGNVFIEPSWEKEKLPSAHTEHNE